MLRVRDIMTADVFTVDPDMSIRDTMELFALKHVTGAPVVAGREIVGVISAADLLAFASELPGIPSLRDESDDSMLAIDDWGDDSDDGDPAATLFVDYWQDAGADVTARYAATEGPEWNRLEEHTVSEVMTQKPLCTIRSDELVKAAAERMRCESIRRVLVVDDGVLVGIITTTDIARAAAQSKLSSRIYVFPPAAQE